MTYESLIGLFSAGIIIKSFHCLKADMLPSRWIRICKANTRNDECHKIKTLKHDEILK